MSTILKLLSEHLSKTDESAEFQITHITKCVQFTRKIFSSDVIVKEKDELSRAVGVYSEVASIVLNVASHVGNVDVVSAMLQARTNTDKLMEDHITRDSYEVVTRDNYKDVTRDN